MSPSVNVASQPATTLDLRQAMRCLAAGVCLVGVEEGGVRHGLVVNSFTSVSLAPPTVLICVNRSASTHETIRRRGGFCVSILGETDRHIADRFADPALRGQRFDIGDWAESAQGHPVLASALAALDCTIVDTVEMGSHSVFFAAVEDIRLCDQTPSPLLYFNGGFRAIA